MLAVKTTKNLTGVEISGSYEDLNMLYDAITNVVGDESSYNGYYQCNMYVLGLCYDIRHAYQGDRKSKKSIYGEKHYCFNWLWPDMIFIYAVLGDFIHLSQGPGCYLTQEDADEMFFAPGTVERLYERLPDDISLVQYFRDLIKNELQRVIDAKRFKAIFKKVNQGHYMRSFCNYRFQMIDMLSVKYMKRAPDKRKSYLALITEKIFFENYEYDDLARSVESYAREYGVEPSEIVLEGSEYPQEIEW